MIPLDVLYQDLYTAASHSDKCPHLDWDGKQCSCRLENTRTVCGIHDIQLWCLAGKERYENCIFYKKLEFNCRSIDDK